MLAPRHVIFTALEDVLLDPRTGLFGEAEAGLDALAERRIPLVLLSSRTRAQLEPLRRKMGHGHPFVTENGGGIFVPDGYFNLRIPGSERRGRHLCVPLGRPYKEVIEALVDIAEECEAGVAGFHHMSAKEIAENTGLRPREAELARDREFDEPFYFTSADQPAIERFVAAARRRGFTAKSGSTFWHLSAGADQARAVTMLSKLFREATRIKMRAVGIASASADASWLRAVDQPILLASPARHAAKVTAETTVAVTHEISTSWSESILNIISEY